MKTIMITIMTFLPMLSSAHDNLPIFQEWESLKSDVHKHLSNKNYEKAIESANRLLAIDPSNDEAKFHLLFSYIKSEKKIPKWIKHEVVFSNTNTGNFYKSVLSKSSNAN